MAPSPSPDPDVGIDPMVSRRAALADLLRRAGLLRSPAVEAAIRAVPRHLFLPAEEPAEAYADKAIVTQTGADGEPTSSASQPSIVAIMLEQLAVQPGQRVLEVGAGTGYNAALLAYLVGAAGRVVSIDVDPETAAGAREHLAAAGVPNVEVLAADGWLGHRDGAPYDRVVATVGIWDVSPSWLDQLADDGLLVAPLWLGPGLQTSIAFRRVGDELHSGSVVLCGFMRLRGAGAGPERYRPVAGWQVAGEGLGAGATSVLARLLITPPRSEPAPPVARGWLLRLALAGAAAVVMTDESRGRSAAGLFDPAAESLALAEGPGGWLGHWAPETVQSYGEGDGRLTERLLALLGTPEPLDASDLHVLVLPRDRPVKPAPADADSWVLDRPHHRFVVTARRG